METNKFWEKYNKLLQEKGEISIEKYLDNFLDKYKDKNNILELCKIAYQKLGKTKKALKACNLILRLNPQRIDVIEEKAEILYDLGDYIKYEKVIKNLINIAPENDKYYKELLNFYKEHNRFEDIKNLLPVAYKNTGDELFAKYPDNLKEPEPEVIDISQNNNIILEMLNIFQGRENVHARQWVNDSGKYGYIPVKQPLTYNKLINHLAGNSTLGVYQLDLDNKVKFLCFDIDILKYARYEMNDNPKYKEYLYDKLKDIVKEIVNLLKSPNIIPYIEFSGYKGYHIWIFLKDKITAQAGKIFLEEIMKQIKISEKSPIGIEVFPKQTKVNKDNFGNLIKIPLGIHLKTGKRSYFTDENFNIIEADRFFKHLNYTPSSIIFKAIKKLQLINGSQIQSDNQDGSKKTNLASIETIPEETIYPEEEFDLETHKGYQIILSKCIAIKSIVDKINDQFQITNQERLVLTYTLGHLDKGAKVVNTLLKKCVNISPEKYMKSSFSGNPVSCPKIRSRLRNLISYKECNCQFSDLLNSYPNPLLHLKIYENESRDIAKIDKIKLKILVESYLSSRKQLKELQQKINIQEEKLIDYFKQAGLDKIDTSFGTLRIYKKNKKFSFHLEI